MARTTNTTPDAPEPNQGRGQELPPRLSAAEYARQDEEVAEQEQARLEAERRAALNRETLELIGEDAIRNRVNKPLMPSLFSKWRKTLYEGKKTRLEAEQTKLQALLEGKLTEITERKRHNELALIAANKEVRLLRQKAAVYQKEIDSNTALNNEDRKYYLTLLDSVDALLEAAKDKLEDAEIVQSVELEDLSREEAWAKIAYGEAINARQAKAAQAEMSLFWLRDRRWAGQLKRDKQTLRQLGIMAMKQEKLAEKSVPNIYYERAFGEAEPRLWQVGDRVGRTSVDFENKPEGVLGTIERLDDMKAGSGVARVKWDAGEISSLPTSDLQPEDVWLTNMGYKNLAEYEASLKKQKEAAEPTVEAEPTLTPLARSMREKRFQERLQEKIKTGIPRGEARRQLIAEDEKKKGIPTISEQPQPIVEPEPVKVDKEGDWQKRVREKREEFRKDVVPNLPIKEGESVWVKRSDGRWNQWFVKSFHLGMDDDIEATVTDQMDMAKGSLYKIVLMNELLAWQKEKANTEKAAEAEKAATPSPEPKPLGQIQPKKVEISKSRLQELVDTGMTRKEAEQQLIAETAEKEGMPATGEQAPELPKEPEKKKAETVPGPFRIGDKVHYRTGKDKDWEDWEIENITSDEKFVVITRIGLGGQERKPALDVADLQELQEEYAAEKNLPGEPAAATPTPAEEAPAGEIPPVAGKGEPGIAEAQDAELLERETKLSERKKKLEEQDTVLREQEAKLSEHRKRIEAQKTELSERERKMVLPYKIDQLASQLGTAEKIDADSLLGLINEIQKTCENHPELFKNKTAQEAAEKLKDRLNTMKAMLEKIKGFNDEDLIKYVEGNFQVLFLPTVYLDEQTLQDVSYEVIGKFGGDQALGRLARFTHYVLPTAIQDLLKKDRGFQSINPEQGDVFDETRHNAVRPIPTTDPTKQNKIHSVVRPGLEHKGKVPIKAQVVRFIKP